MAKILINALQFSPDGAGISKYSYKIADIIMKKNPNVDVLCREDMVNKFNNRNQLIPVKVSRSVDRIINEQIRLLKIYKNYDVVHFLDYATPVLYRGKKIATIHDMAMHTMKDKYTKKQVLIKSALLKSTIRSADKIICISEFTKKELLKYYPNIDENRIEVAYNGFDYSKKDYSKENIDVTLGKFDINKEYFLFVGTISPHKNIERIIESFNEIKLRGYDYQLVICGKKGWLYNSIFNKVKELNLENKVVFTDYVTDEELEILYENAKLFVFPSLYEGFGFPPIEAMARNLPVISSREGSIPEVVGDAAMFCDAYSVNDISSRIIDVIDDDNLRARLIENGKNRVKYFSWENLYKKISDIYTQLLSIKV